MTNFKIARLGSTITSKLQEYVDTGKLNKLEKEKTNPIVLLTGVYGIGPKKAEELVKLGITTIDQLRESKDIVLNEAQRVGLQHYEDILERIPREEIDRYQTYLPQYSLSPLLKDQNSI